jgi:hypothetical protein
MSEANALADLLAAVKRIEARQGAFDQALRRLMGALDIHNEKLDAILAAATREPGPSPVAAMLGEILTTMQDQARLLGGPARGLGGDHPRRAGAGGRRRRDGAGRAGGLRSGG